MEIPEARGFMAAHVYTPSPDDFSYNFKKLQSAYAAIALLTNNGSGIREAIACYGKIDGHQEASVAFDTQNMAKTLKKSIANVRCSAKFWQKEVGSVDFQPDYARYAAMASQDCSQSLAAAHQAEKVLETALNETEKGNTLGIAAGAGTAELQQSYLALKRLRLYMEKFVKDLEPLHTVGNIEIQTKNEKVDTRRLLGRDVKPREKNPVFEIEVTFWAIIGMIQAEGDMIRSALQTGPDSLEMKKGLDAFNIVAKHISDYAKYDVKDIWMAMSTLMHDSIPDCRNALEKIGQIAPDETSVAVLAALNHCLTRLHEDGPNKGNAL